MSFSRVFRELEYIICKIAMEELHVLNYPVNYNKAHLLPIIENDYRYEKVVTALYEEFNIHVALEVENNKIDITLLRDDEPRYI